MFLSHKFPTFTKFFLLSILVFALVSCSKNTSENSAAEAEKATEAECLAQEQAAQLEQEKKQEEERQAKIAERKRNAITSYLSQLSQTEKLAQLFLVNLQGNTDFEPVEYKDDKAVIPGGYLFFSFNIGKNAEEIMHFSDSIASYCTQNALVPPYLSIDQEGGLVNRLRGITSSVPSCRTIATKYSEEEAKALYDSQAKQLALLGFSLNLAPVAEVSDSDNSDFLGTRSYGDSTAVKTYASLAVKSYEENGIGTVLKHFPGNTNTDPHTGLPEIKLSDEELEKTVIEPFSHVINTASPSAVLMSHARTTAHDGDKPACFSHYWISQILRDKMQFQGLILSDDIFMAALEKNGYPPEKAVTMAIEAGVDCIMLSEKKFVNVLTVLEKKAAQDENFAHLLDDAVRRVIQYKIKAHILQITEEQTENDKTTLTLSDVAKENVQTRLQRFEEEKARGDSCVK